MIDFFSQTKIVREKTVNERLTLIESASLDNTVLYLHVRYMGGKFSTHKIFPNTFDGVSDLKTAKVYFNTEYKVRKYFKIGEL